MRTLWKAALAALSITAFAGVAGSANAQPYDDYRYDPGYGSSYDAPYGDYGYDLPPDGVPYDYASGGYCDEWGCPDGYYDLPVYYGPVYYGGSWFNGPLYYRDWGGSRQYWLRGAWHYDTWRGSRPSWYRQGTYGPALGRSFYSGGGFRNFAYNNNRGGYNRYDNRRYDNRGNYGRNDFNRPNVNRNDNRGFNGGRSDFNRNDNRSFAAPAQQQAAPQNRGSFGGQRYGAQGQRQDFQRSNAARPDFQNRGGQDRGNFQRSEARPQSQRGDSGGNRNRGGDRGNRGDRNR